MHNLTPIFLLLTFTANMPAADNDSPTKIIGPFVAEQTFVVLRMDVAQVKTEPLFKLFDTIAPNAHEAAAPLKRWLDAFARAGVKEAYLGMSLSDSLGQGFAVIPLANDIDTAQFKSVFADLPRSMTHRVHKGVLLLGAPAVLDRLTANDNRPTADLESAFTAVKDAALQGVVLLPPLLRRAVVETMPRLPTEIGGGATEDLAKGFRWGAFGIDSPPRESIRAVVQAANAESAQKLSVIIKQGIALLAKSEEVRNVPGAAEVLKALTPTTNADRITLLAPQDDLARLLSANVVKARLAAQRIQSLNNLKQLALAMHLYHDVQKSFPPVANHDANGKPLLSWRVHLLPYLDEQALYKEFHLDESWDSPHNKKLLERMPSVFRSPLLKDASRSKTTYVVPVGKDTIFSGEKGTKIADITDGTSNTLLIVEVNDANAVIWTKPDDLDSDTRNALSRLVQPEIEGFLATFADGSARLVAQTIERDTLQAFFRRNDGK